jgi:hypothetical protein
MSHSFSGRFSDVKIREFIFAFSGRFAWILRAACDLLRQDSIIYAVDFLSPGEYHFLRTLGPFVCAEKYGEGSNGTASCFSVIVIIKSLHFSYLVFALPRRSKIFLPWSVWSESDLGKRIVALLAFDKRLMLHSSQRWKGRHLHMINHHLSPGSKMRTLLARFVRALNLAVLRLV